MRLHRVKFRGFGRWIDREFEFKDGINLVEAPNEAGKSTLLTGIFALLYGPKKEGTQIRTRADWLERYAPWTGGGYGGEIEYSLSGKRFRLVRNLDWKREKEELFDLEAEREITGEFPPDQRKDRQFLERQIRLSGESLRRIIFLTSGTLPQDGRKEKKGGDSQVLERLKRLVVQGEDYDVNRAVRQLDASLAEIGTARASTRPYGAALARKEQLEREIAEMAEKREQYVREREELKKLEEQFRLIDAEKGELESLLTEIREKAERQQATEMLHKELQHLIMERNNIRMKLDEHRESCRKMEELQVECDRTRPPRPIYYEQYYELAEKQRQKQALLQQIEEFDARLAELDRSLEEMVQTHAKLLQMDESRSLGVLHQLKEIRRLEERNEELAAMLDKSEESGSWGEIRQDLLRLDELQKEAKTLEQDKMRVQLRLTQLTDRPVWKWMLRSWGWLAVCVAGVIATVPLAIWLPAVSPVPLIMAGWAGFRFHRGRMADQVRREQQEAEREELRARLEEVCGKISANEASQRELMQRWQAESIGHMVQKQADILEEMKKRENWKREAAENREAIEHLKKEAGTWLADYLEEVPEWSAAEWLESARNLVTRFRQVKSELHQFQLERSMKRKEQEDRKRQLESVRAFLEAWEARFGTTDPETAKKWMDQTETLLKLEQKLSEERKKFLELEELRRKERWEEQERELEERILQLQSMLADYYSGMTEPQVDWKARLLDAERELSHFIEKWREHKETMDRLRGSIDQLEEWLEEMSIKAAERVRAEEEIDRIRRRRNVLEIAREALDKAAREVRDNIAPRLVPHAAGWIRQVTDGRYSDLLIDVKNGIRLDVFVPETGEKKSVDRLSQGTIDQMFFAMRLSLVQFYSEHTGTRLPLFLDDCFVHFDEERIRRAIRLLAEFSREHQIILCTCQNRERRLMEEEGIRWHEVKLA
ncbi:AAA family ATPase [Staphylospora marina]|uniref:AAA family ATPase n=1 Tax=Staphylospora marina TaxID=2490858 RepID=UPI000F5C19EC|nr:AAA family ATPase [Staphylospora marina]